MTNKQPYPEEFKIEAVKQITERGHRVADVSARIGVSQHSLYKWNKGYAIPAHERQTQTSHTEEVRRLKAEPKRVTEECHIFKKWLPCTLPCSPGEVRVRKAARAGIQRATHVQSVAGPPQRLLRVEGATAKPTGEARPAPAAQHSCRLGLVRGSELDGNPGG